MSRLNNALIVLLPKKVGAANPGDFRPITMIHSFAKLVSKILALRLAPRIKNGRAHSQEPEHIHQELEHPRQLQIYTTSRGSDKEKESAYAAPQT
jgi:hypothetical protein